MVIWNRKQLIFSIFRESLHEFKIHLFWNDVEFSVIKYSKQDNQTYWFPFSLNSLAFRIQKCFESRG